MPTSLRAIKTARRSSHRGKTPTRRKRETISPPPQRIIPTTKLLRLALLLAGGVFLLAGYVTKMAAQTSSAALIHTTFASEPVSIDTRLTKESSLSGQLQLPVRVLIPSINLDVPVQAAPVIHGYWQVYDDRAGFGVGSAYPQDQGNTVIFAHAREHLFLHLPDVAIGSAVYIITNDHWYRYVIREKKEVLPTQKEVIAPTEDATVTLYTCSGFGDNKRLIVVGKRTPL